MSSIGAIGTSGAWLFVLSCVPTRPCSLVCTPQPETTQEFIALKRNFRNPLDWHALIRLSNEENVASRSTRRMIVVGRLPVGFGLDSAGLEVELDQVGLVLDRLNRLVQRLHLAADQEVAFFIHVQDQSIFRDPLPHPRPAGPTRRPAGGPAGRSFRC